MLIGAANVANVVQRAQNPSAVALSSILTNFIPSHAKGALLAIAISTTFVRIKSLFSSVITKQELADDFGESLHFSRTQVNIFSDFSHGLIRLAVVIFESAKILFELQQAFFLLVTQNQQIIEHLLIKFPSLFSNETNTPIQIQWAAIPSFLRPDEANRRKIDNFFKGPETTPPPPLNMWGE